MGKKAGAVLPDLYEPLVEWCQGTGRTAEEIVEFAERHKVSIGVARVHQVMRPWTQAGAFIGQQHQATRQDGRKVLRNRWFSTSRALSDADVIARALGPARANRIFEAKGIPAKVVEDAPPAAVERFEPEPEPDEPNMHAAPRPAMPDRLFTGTFTRDGVLISYEQFHRVVSLLGYLSEEASA